MLDAEEEPLQNKWEQTHWSCQQCGIAMDDVWSKKLCNGCMKMNDPNWRAGKLDFKPPPIVYAHHFKQEERHDHEWKMRQQRMEEAAEQRKHEHEHHHHNHHHHEGDHRATSKHSVHSHTDDIRKSTKESRKSERSNDERKPSRISVAGEGERHVKDDTRTHSKRHSMTEETPEEAPVERPPSQPLPDIGAVPFGDIKPKLLMAKGHEHRMSSKEGHGHGHHHHGHHGHGDHHHHHHHHHHHDGHRHGSKDKRSSQIMDLVESQEGLQKLYDARGEHLTMGERVIGEGDIGLDMGPGTITGSGQSHGHGMVLVQYDGSGHKHPMKAEHLLKLTPKLEADFKKYQKEHKKK